MSVSSLVRRCYRRLRRRRAEDLDARILLVELDSLHETPIASAIRACYDARWTKLNCLDPSACVEGARRAGIELDEYRRQLLMYFLLQPECRYVSGYFLFDLELMGRLAGGWNLVTLLSDPVERWFAESFASRSGTRQAIRDVEELDEFLTTEKAAALGRRYVRQFNGGRDPLPGELPAAIDRALAELEQFRVVGCVERLERFVADFRQAFGVTLRLGRKNVNAVWRENQQREITPEIRARVEELCAPDLEVYRRAVDESDSVPTVVQATRETVVAS